MTTTTNTDAPAYIVDGVLTDGEAWVPLKTTILGSDTVGVEWTSSTGANDWSQYMDLVIIAYSQSTTTANGVLARFNNDTTTANYAYQYYYGDGSTVSAAEGTGPAGCWLLYSDKHATQNNTYACAVATVYDINSGKHKTLTSTFADDRDAGGGYTGQYTTTWLGQAPITEIDLIDGNGNAFAADSRYDLFGVLPRMVTA